MHISRRTRILFLLAVGTIVALIAVQRDDGISQKPNRAEPVREEGATHLPAHDEGGDSAEVILRPDAISGTGQIAVCCQGDNCQLLSELDCTAARGYWLSTITTCGSQADCRVLDSDNPCCTGSCCRGAAVGVICQDETPEEKPMDKAKCDAIPGTYVGGAQCHDLLDPCPTCRVASDVNCQESARGRRSRSRVHSADRDMIPDGRRTADDFVASDNAIDTVCFDGAYIDSQIDCGPPTRPRRCDCACVDDDPYNCVPTVLDKFTICIWNDSAGIPGESTLPGSLVGCQTGVVARSRTGPPETAHDWKFDLWQISVVLDTPIPTVEGQTYWLEIHNTTDVPTGNTCNFYWAEDRRADDSENPSGNDRVMHDLDADDWEVRDIEDYDMAFCLNYSIEPPPIPATGACCDCEPLGDCTDDVPFVDCFGSWKLGKTCGPGICEASRPANDLFENRTKASIGSNAFSNICATHGAYHTLNGPGADPDPASQCVDTSIGSDVWYEYTGCGALGGEQVELTVSLCDKTVHDTVLALYSNGTQNCISTEPVDDANLVECNDDACSPLFAPSEVHIVAKPGVCYTIRVGGWRDRRCDRSAPEYDPANCHADCADGCQGTGFLTIQCGD